MLDASSSNIDGFVWRDRCISTTQLNRPIWSNRAYLHLEIYDFQEVFLSKTNSILTGKQCLFAPACTMDGFLRRDTCVFSTLLNRAIWNKVSLSLP
jgi:hypothetical protein